MDSLKFPSNPSIQTPWEAAPKRLNETKAEEEPIKICRDVFTPGTNEPPILSRKDLAPYMGTGGIGLPPQTKSDQPLPAPLLDMRRLMGTGGL